jgi:hypothetical protein
VHLTNALINAAAAKTIPQTTPTSPSAKQERDILQVNQTYAKV